MTPSAPVKAKLLLAVASIASALVLAELILRLVPGFSPRPWTYVGEFENRPSKNFTADPATGWKMPPHHGFRYETSEFRTIYRSNLQGFRGNSDFEPADKRPTIIVAGDSFAFGVGVEYEQTYGAIIESRLPGTVVYNLAMPGFGLDQIWLSVKHYALPLKPDLVTIGLIGDSFSRSQLAYRHMEGFNKPIFKLVDGRLVPKTPEDRPTPVVRFVQRRSHLWRAGELAFLWFAYRIPLGEWWFLNEAILDAIRTECGERGVPVLFVYHPSKGWRRFPSLRAHMRRVGANFIDLTDDPTPPPRMYFPRDWHYTPEGHRYVAEAVVTWIRKNLPGLAGRPAPPRASMTRPRASLARPT